MQAVQEELTCKLCNSRDVTVVAETEDKKMLLCHTCDRIHSAPKN